MCQLRLGHALTQWEDASAESGNWFPRREDASARTNLGRTRKSDATPARSGRQDITTRRLAHSGRPRASHSSRRNLMPAITQSQLRLDLQTMIRALEKHCSKQKLHLDGSVVRSADLIKDLKERLRLLDEADARRAEWLRAVHVLRANEARNAALSKHLKTFVANHFGVGSPTFLEFGFLPRKIAKKSTATKANAVRKSLATRASRRPPLPVPAPVPVPAPSPSPSPSPHRSPSPLPLPSPSPHPSPLPLSTSTRAPRDPRPAGCSSKLRTPSRPSLLRKRDCRRAAHCLASGPRGS